MQKDHLIYLHNLNWLWSSRIKLKLWDNTSASAFILKRWYHFQLCHPGKTPALIFHRKSFADLALSLSHKTYCCSICNIRNIIKTLIVSFILFLSTHSGIFTAYSQGIERIWIFYFHCRNGKNLSLLKGKSCKWNMRTCNRLELKRKAVTNLDCNERMRNILVWAQVITLIFQIVLGCLWFCNHGQPGWHFWLEIDAFTARVNSISWLWVTSHYQQVKTSLHVGPLTCHLMGYYILTSSP